MHKKHFNFLWSVAVIGMMLLTACGGGAGTTATSEVPATGNATATMAPVLATNTPMMEATSTTASMTTETPAMGTTETPAANMATETPAAAQATVAPWKGEQIGGTVSVLAIWGGSELDNFNAMIKPFEEQTGITVQYEGTRDLGAVLNTRVSGGNPPDLAGLPNPGQMVALANQGALKPLNDVLDMQQMQAQYDQGFLDLASVNGQMYGIFTKAAVKSLVWYDPKQFEANGWTPPTTWDELNTLEQKMIDFGVTPWCIGIDGGGGSGWPGTDWVEDIMLRTAGPDTYTQWYEHKIPWTSDAVKNAFDTWGTIVNDPKMVYGGPQTVIATNFGQAFVPMFQDPPQCYLHRQASFITTFFTDQFPDLQAGTDYNFFVFPPIDEQYGNPLEVAGDLFGMFNDTPQARALMQYLVTPDAQSIWASKGGFISANKTVDPNVYPDQISQQIAKLISTASAVRFDASDLMPEAVNSAFSTGVLNYVSDPNSLDSDFAEYRANGARRV